VAVVTGAARGLGRAYARELAARGAKVVVNDLPESGADRVVDTIEASGGTAIASAHSVATRDEAAAIIADALDRYGRLDVLINNAGMLRNAYFEELTEAQIDAIFDVHLRGVFHVTQPAFKAMREQGYGRIVNVSSNTCFGMAGLSNYATAKAGVIGLTRTLALEGEEHKILVNAVLPNAATTIMDDEPIPGFGEDERFQAAFAAVDSRFRPEHVAPLVVFLASPACTMTGECVSALGGRYARVVFALSRGWMSATSEPAAAEDIGEHVSEIMDLGAFADAEGVLVPGQIRDEFEAVATRLETATARLQAG
jgi:NAD(P)-dependent dehydrogenase (short-subunit alcohol dehydrogenase family)